MKLEDQMRYSFIEIRKGDKIFVGNNQGGVGKDQYQEQEIDYPNNAVEVFVHFLPQSKLNINFENLDEI